MKQSISIIDPRLPALVVGVAALLLMSGCRHLNSTSFRQVSNPRVCPICVAATPDQCHCFPSDVGAGYSETHWSKLASPDPLGSMMMMPSEGMRDVAVPRNRALGASMLVEPAAGGSESADSAVSLTEPANASPELPGESPESGDGLSIPSVVVAKLPDRDRD